MVGNATEQGGVAVTIWTCIQKVHGSHLGRDIDCPDFGFHDFPSRNILGLYFK
jgi:hypothetical protein